MKLFIYIGIIVALCGLETHSTPDRTIIVYTYNQHYPQDTEIAKESNELVNMIDMLNNRAEPMNYFPRLYHSRDVTRRSLQ